MKVHDFDNDSKFRAFLQRVCFLRRKSYFLVQATIAEEGFKIDWCCCSILIVAVVNVFIQVLHIPYSREN